MPAKATDVARYLLHLAGQEPEPCVTPLALQKLLYYAQGWSLAARGRPLFDDKLQAWRDGPAVHAVYREFNRYGRGPIPTTEGRADGLSEADRLIVNSVWAGYGQYSASRLWRMTHAEPPWLETRGTLSPDADSQDEIPHERMEKHFQAEYARSHMPGLGPDDIRRGRREIAEGRGVRFSEVIARRRDAV